MKSVTLLCTGILGFVYASAIPNHTMNAVESCRWFSRHKEHTHIVGKNVLIDQIVSVDDQSVIVELSSDWLQLLSSLEGHCE